MKALKLQHHVALLAAAFALAVLGQGSAQGYPNKPIRVVREANIKAE